MKKLDSIISKYKQSRFFRMSKIITTSATFALFLSIAFFVYETWDSKNEQKEVIGNLLQIQNSLTTKYLGLFPEYISGINGLFEEGLETYTHNSLHKVDTIVIFEDVLYYGIKSRPEGFLHMNELLYQLVQRDCQVYIAYYRPQGRVFKQMVRESLIAPEFFSDYSNDMQAYYKSLRLINMDKEKLLAQYPNATKEIRDSIGKILFHQYLDTILHLENLNDISIKQRPITQDTNVRNRVSAMVDYNKVIDSIKCEEYYQKSVALNPKKYIKSTKDYLRPIPQIQNADTAPYVQKLNVLALQLDSIKQNTIGQNRPKDVTFADYQTMYVGFTHLLETFYGSLGSNVHMIPLDDYLTMSCWMISSDDNKDKAIFAFPSKYATEEIGFESRDRAIANYIQTMLRGAQIATHNQ